MGSWLLVYEVWRCPSLRGPPRSEAGPNIVFGAAEDFDLISIGTCHER